MDLFCDLDWIQTSNLLSRNQVRYSVAPQGHFAYLFTVKVNAFAGANIGNFYNGASLNVKYF